MVLGVSNWRAEDIPGFDIAGVFDNYSVMDEGFNFMQDACNQ